MPQDSAAGLANGNFGPPVPRKPKPVKPHARLPSTGFTEAWLRQFLEQMPSGSSSDLRVDDMPSVGRRVLGASGEQMVYVDELHPNEILMLMQYVFHLEEHLKRAGQANTDLTQRVPHSFTSGGQEISTALVLRKFFDDYPYQCTTTGLRFASRDKMRKHHDALFKRRSAKNTKGTESRGWMESIPEWVGNRDLVVGPTFFRLGPQGEDGGKDRDTRPQDEEDDDADFNKDSLWVKNRWACPRDERRALCPVSGEAFTSLWCHELNCWVYEDAVAVEPGSEKPLDFLGRPS